MRIAVCLFAILTTIVFFRLTVRRGNGYRQFVDDLLGRQWRRRLEFAILEDSRRRNDLLCITTHLTVDHLAFVLQRLAPTIPVSAAVLATTRAELAGLFQVLYGIGLNCAGAFENVSLHIIAPSRVLNGDRAHLLDSMANDRSDVGRWCRLLADPERFQRHFAKTMTSSDVDMRSNYQRDVAYPSNMLRNVALNASDCAWVLPSDADLVPSRDFATQWARFVERRRGESDDDDNLRRVYVVAAFEIQSDRWSDAPRVKAELQQAVRSGYVRPFYEAVCADCQRSTDYRFWFNAGTDPAVRVLFRRQWTHPWEPFFIARRSALPAYDERFRQYGYNRVTLICELHMRRVEFVVVDGVFLLHDGFKRPGDFHASMSVEHARNRRLYWEFSREVAERYASDAASATRRCFRV